MGQTLASLLTFEKECLKENVLKRRGDICILIADSCCCTAETNKHYKTIILQFKKGNVEVGGQKTIEEVMLPQPCSRIYSPLRGWEHIQVL